MKGIIDGNPCHTIIHFSISDLKSKEFSRVFEISQIFQTILQVSNLEGIFNDKDIRKLIEPWKATQNKRPTTLQQMDYNISEKEIKQKFTGLTGNLIDNHLLNILSLKLKDYVNFILEVNPDNYKEFLILKDQIPKTFSFFSDHFSFQHSSNSQKQQADQIDSLIKEPVQEEIMKRFWNVEKDVNQIFEINYFQTTNKNMKEISFYLPYMSRLIEQHLQNTMDTLYAKRQLVQLINSDMIKNPINSKLKALLEQLLEFKVKYISIKKSYEQICETYQSNKDYKHYKENYLKNPASITLSGGPQEKNTQELKRRSSILSNLNKLEGEMKQLGQSQNMQEIPSSSLIQNKSIYTQYNSQKNLNKSVPNEQSVQMQEEQKIVELHKQFIADVKLEINRIKEKSDEAKKSYQNAFYNFRQINLLLCQLLKTIHYYRYECNPLLTFDGEQLSKYAHDISLYALAGLKYPASYRETLFQVLSNKNDKLNIPFYKVLNENPLVYLEQLLNGQNLGLHILNEYSLINFLLTIDILPLCITDETGLYLEYLQFFQAQKQKRTVFVEYNTVDKDTLENVENCILSGSYLVLYNPDEILIDTIQPILQFKYRNLIKNLLSFKNPTHTQKQEELFTFNARKVKIHPQFRLIIITSSYSSFLIKNFSSTAIFVHLSFQDVILLFN